MKKNYMKPKMEVNAVAIPQILCSSIVLHGVSFSSDKSGEIQLADELLDEDDYAY